MAHSSMMASRQRSDAWRTARSARSRRLLLELALPVLLLVTATALLSIDGRELALQGRFWDPAQADSPNQGWALREHSLWAGLYAVARLPGLCMAVLAFLVLVGGVFSEPLKRLRRPAAFLVLVALLGPLLTVNSVLKDNWGRARPVETLDFGGWEPYRPVWEIGWDAESCCYSFPSGHAAMAFYLLTPYFLLRRRSPRQAAGFLAFGLGFGLLVGIGRVVQGGHYATDILWAGGVVYLIALGLSAVPYFRDHPIS